jgi:hypothetical protein
MNIIYCFLFIEESSLLNESVRTKRPGHFIRIRRGTERFLERRFYS